MVSMKIFVMSILLVFVACNGQRKTVMDNEDASGNNMLQLVLSDDHGGTDISETLLITNAKALKSFFTKINMTRKPGLQMPEVDFEKEMIVIACSGKQSDGSFPRLAIKEETTSQMVLSTALRLDEKNTSQAITTPFSIYKMPLTEKEIVFEVGNQ